jgi:hypothetical protein
MLRTKLVLLRFVIGFLALALCQACNPYGTRRVPLGNYPYMNCKNCNGGKTKKLDAKQVDDDDYSFTSAAHQKTIQPLPISLEPKPKKKLKVTKASARRPAPNYVRTVNKRRPAPASYGVVTEQDLAANSTKAAQPNKNNGYVPLTQIPEKQYLPDQQKEVLLDKKATIKDLSAEANKMAAPTTTTPTLETEQMPAAPSKAGEMKLNDKLQELQKMVKESAPVAPQQEAPAPVAAPTQAPTLAPTPTPAPVPTQGQPMVQPQQEATIQPFILQQEAPAPAAPTPAQSEVRPQQPTPTKPDNDASSSSYDLESKPIPLPY